MILNNREIIASLIIAANELDDLELHEDADILTSMAGEITAEESDLEKLKLKQYLEDAGANVK